MKWSELINATNLDKIEVIINKPLRKDKHYNKGDMLGFKPAHYNARGNLIKPAKVFVGYYSSIFGKGRETDWINATDCDFTINNDTGKSYF